MIRWCGSVLCIVWMLIGIGTFRRTRKCSEGSETTSAGESVEIRHDGEEEGALGVWRIL